MKKFYIPACIVIIIVFLSGCISMEDLGLDSVLTEDDKKLISATEKITKSFEDFTPEQEYYIGRSVGAIILGQYKPYNNQKANAYVNTLGQTLAAFCERPEIFAGYHFLILDSMDINAFATPGGHVFISRGLLSLAESEDSVAAILAHEIGHVVKKHGVKSIKQANITDAFANAAMTMGAQAGDKQLAELTAKFTDSLNDITKKLIVNGYSREYEKEADTSAVKILLKVGYDARALISLLEILDRSYKPGAMDFAKTHPAPKERISAAEKDMKGAVMNEPTSKSTDARFKAFRKEL